MLSSPKVHSSLSNNSFDEEMDQVFKTRQKNLGSYKAKPKAKRMTLRSESDKVFGF